MGIMLERIKKFLGIRSRKKEPAKKRMIESSSLYETRVLTEEELLELTRERSNAAHRSGGTSWEDIDD